MCRPASNPTKDIFRTAYITKNLINLPSKPTDKLTRNRSSTDKTKTPLPLDFEPSEYSVICGNKKQFFNSHGNRRFRVIFQMHLEEYMNAPSKHEKSFVVTKVMKTLKDACPVGAFVAFEKGQWWQVSDRTSREKVGTFFRDCLADSYRSSSKNKIAERRRKRTMFNPMTEDVRCSSPVPSSPVPSSKPAAVITPASTPVPSGKPCFAPLMESTTRDSFFSFAPLPFVAVSSVSMDPLDIDDASCGELNDDEALMDALMDTCAITEEVKVDIEPTPIALITEEEIEPTPLSSIDIPLDTYDDDSSSVGNASAASFNPVDAFIYSFFDE